MGDQAEKGTGVLQASNVVASLLYKEIPRRLWHYTSFEGFEGIVRSGKIWATDIRYLNDTSEFLHTQSIAKSIIDQLPNDKDLAFTKRHASELIRRIWSTGYLSPEKLEVYTSSFTVLKDTLSQWRGYGGGSLGISLGFDLRAFRPPSSAETLVTFAPCVYDESSKEELVKYALDHFVNETTKLWKYSMSQTWAANRLAKWKDLDEDLKADAYSNSIENWNKEFFRLRMKAAYHHTVLDLVRIAALCKHGAFHEEQEWRLTLPIETGRTLKTLTRLYRSVQDAKIPYVASSLSRSGPALPLTEIIVGPSTGAVQVAQRVKAVLASTNYDVTVTISSIPFR
jgi:hypothetical protein